MELIDVLDQEGKKTGEVLRRSEIHRLGKWHLVVHVWIINKEGQILLQKRSMNKEMDSGKWDVSAGGHASSGDDSLTTAQKEIQEELGIEIPKEEIKFIGTLTAQNIQRNGRFINNEFNDVYIVRADTQIKNMTLQKEEVDEVRFVPLEEMKERLSRSDDTMAKHDGEYRLLFQYLKI